LVEEQSLKFLIEKQILCVQLGAVHKGRHRQGEEVVQCGHFVDKGEGFFRCGRPHFLAQKTSDFSKCVVCPHGQGEG